MTNNKDGGSKFLTIFFFTIREIPIAVSKILCNFAL